MKRERDRRIDNVLQPQQLPPFRNDARRWCGTVTAAELFSLGFPCKKQQKGAESHSQSPQRECSEFQRVCRQHSFIWPPCPPRQSHVGAVGGGRRFRLAPYLLDVLERRVAAADLALEHLLVGLPEVLRQEGVDDRVHRGVAVGEAVCGDPQHKGGLVQREGPELHPQVDDVMREPGEAEDHHHHQDRLSRLGATGQEERGEFRRLNRSQIDRLNRIYSIGMARLGIEPTT